MNNINTSFKKIYSLLILTFSFFLILINTTHSEEKIGSIVSLNEEVYAVNTDGEKRLLDLYDEIFLLLWLNYHYIGQLQWIVHWL